MIALLPLDRILISISDQCVNLTLATQVLADIHFYSSNQLKSLNVIEWPLPSSRVDQSNVPVKKKEGVSCTRAC